MSAREPASTVRDVTPCCRRPSRSFPPSVEPADYGDGARGSFTAAHRGSRTADERRQAGTGTFQRRGAHDAPRGAVRKPAARSRVCLPRGSAGAAPFADRLNERTYVVSARSLGRLSDLEAPPSIVAVHACSSPEPRDILQRGVPVVVLAGVADPGNAGTLIRSAEIFGFGAALFCDNAVDPYNPKVVRATMGAIFRLMLGTARRNEVVCGCRAFWLLCCGGRPFGHAAAGLPLSAQTPRRHRQRAARCRRLAHACRFYGRHPANGRWSKPERSRRREHHLLCIFTATWHHLSRLGDPIALCYTRV